MHIPGKSKSVLLTILFGCLTGLPCCPGLAAESEETKPLARKITPSGLEVSILEVTNLDEFLMGTCPPGRSEVPKLDQFMRKGVLVHFTIKPLPSYKGTALGDWGTAIDSSGRELWKFATAPEPELLKALKGRSDVLHCKYPFYGEIIGIGQKGDYPILQKFRFDNTEFSFPAK